LVADVLSDAGYSVAELGYSTVDAVMAYVNRLEPDVVLLDGCDRLEYGASWRVASWLHERQRPIKVIMFAVTRLILQGGRLRLTERSQRAAFIGFVSKPFDVHDLLEAVQRASRH
jgi:FixJ family two-component response regulator